MPSFQQAIQPSAKMTKAKRRTGTLIKILTQITYFFKNIDFT